MTNSKGNYTPELASYSIRPALVEARLITEKYAGDPVYVVTLAEELRDIEAKIAAREQAAQAGSSPAAAHIEVPPITEDMLNANWIRSKSGELESRLRRIERSSK